MRSKSYYFNNEGSFGIYKGSRECVDRPLIINCSGRFYTESPLNTDARGRLDYYLLYILEGELSIDLKNGISSLEPGNFIIIPPRTSYKYFHSEGSALSYFWVHFTGSEVDKILATYGLPIFPEFGAARDFSEVTRRIQGFLDACSTEEKFKDEELSLIFERMLLIIARSTDNSASPLKRSLSYINSHYNTELKIPELAKMENLSSSRYNAVFKRIFGIPPLEYIIKTRIAFACDLLMSTNLSIKEISMQVGYSDPHFFSRIFKSQTGLSPSSYREAR